MEVVAATFRRTSESRQVPSLPGARPPTRLGPCPMHYSALTEPWCSVSADNDEDASRSGCVSVAALVGQHIKPRPMSLHPFGRRSTSITPAVPSAKSSVTRAHAFTAAQDRAPVHRSVSEPPSYQSRAVLAPSMRSDVDREKTSVVSWTVAAWRW